MSEKLMVKAKQFKWAWFFKAATLSVVLLTIAYLGFFSPQFGQPFYNWLLFHPWKYPHGLYNNPAVVGIKPRDVYFNAPDGSRLHAWLYKAQKSQRIFLFSHGNGANITFRSGVSAMLLKTGNSVFVYDYEGFGRSEGQPSMAKVCDDGLAAYNYLVDDLHYSPKQIMLFGESLGTSVTGDIASRVKCAAVILECPLYSIIRRGNELLPITNLYPAWMWPHNGLDNSKVFAKEHAPLLIVAGTKDYITPVAHGDDLFAIACQPKSYIRIEGAGHGDQIMMQSPRYESQLRQFLNSIQ